MPGEIGPLQEQLERKSWQRQPAQQQVRKSEVRSVSWCEMIMLKGREGKGGMKGKNVLFSLYIFAQQKLWKCFVGQAQHLIN